MSAAEAEAIEKASASLSSCDRVAKSNGVGGMWQAPSVRAGKGSLVPRLSLLRSFGVTTLSLLRSRIFYLVYRLITD